MCSFPKNPCFLVLGTEICLLLRPYGRGMTLFQDMVIISFCSGGRRLLSRSSVEEPHPSVFFVSFFLPLS